MVAKYGSLNFVQFLHQSVYTVWYSKHSILHSHSVPYSINCL